MTGTHQIDQGGQALQAETTAHAMALGYERACESTQAQEAWQHTREGAPMGEDAESLDAL